LTYENVDAYFKTVSDVKINIAYTLIQVSLSDRYISDTILAGLKRQHAPLNFQTLGHFLSNDPKRYDLTYLHNRISVEVGPSQLPSAAPLTEVQPSAASPSDAPAAFVTDRQPRAGGKGDEPIAIVNAATILLKAAATAIATLSRAIGKVFQIGLTAIDRNTIDGDSIGDLVENMTNASRKWRLSFETSASATLMKKLIMQKQHLQRRSCALIWNVKRLVLIFLMSFQAWDL
jgi:hypothetical protein